MKLLLRSEFADKIQECETDAPRRTLFNVVAFEDSEDAIEFVIEHNMKLKPSETDDYHDDVIETFRTRGYNPVASADYDCDSIGCDCDSSDCDSSDCDCDSSD
jgi:hypothetical protein